MTFSPGLYLTATPIGNLQDITHRALQVLKEASFIVCEHFNTTKVLLQHFHYYHKSLLSVYKPETLPLVLNVIRKGKVVVLLSDAGTPLISDPGFDIVTAVLQENLPLSIVPGVSSLTAALAVSGLPCDKVFFGGFLPKTSQARQNTIKQTFISEATAVFFCSPTATPHALEDLAELCGDSCHMALIRELTKRYETIIRGTLDQCRRIIKPPLKGEITLVVRYPKTLPHCGLSPQSLDLLITSALNAKEPLKMLSQRLAYETGTPKQILYKRALKLKHSLQ